MNDKCSAQDRLDHAIEKLEVWIHNIEANAAHYEARGYAKGARLARFRAEDFRDVLELLKGE